MKQSLKVKFLIYISVLIICVMGITSGAAYVNSKKVIYEAITRQLSQLVISTSGQIALWIHDRKQDLTNWSGQQLYQTALDDSYLGKAARQSASLRLQEQRQNYQYYESLNLANAQGKVIASSSEKALGENIINQRFVQESLKGNIYFSSAMKSPDSAKPVFIISVPVKRSGVIEGVFYGIIDIGAFNDIFIIPIKIGKTGYVYVIDNEGIAIAHPDKSNILNVNINAYDWGREIMRRKQGFIIYTWKGINKIAFFNKNEELSWTIAAGAGLREIYAPIRQLQLVNFFIAIIFIIVAIFSVIILYGHIILKPMSYLIEGITNVGRGQLDNRIKLETGDEFSELASVFNKTTEDLQKITVSRDELVKENTERKRAEEKLEQSYEKLKATQAQLVQSAKMASVGLLAGGVAHEINNPLTGVINNVQLIRMEAEQKKDFSLNDFRELLTIVEESAMRCKVITQALLDFSHVSKGVFLPVSINQIVEKVLILLEHELKLQNIVIQKELNPDLPLVSGEPQLLQQIILDIISNAKWAIERNHGKEGGFIGLKTEYEPEKNNVCLFISDNGIGIQKENLAKIFEPFFTTKEVGEGTGLGLSIVYSIIKAHHGSIKVESELNKGATFKISLPYI